MNHPKCHTVWLSPPYSFKSLFSTFFGLIVAQVLKCSGMAKAQTWQECSPIQSRREAAKLPADTRRMWPAAPYSSRYKNMTAERGTA
ncbi:hypothetical protein GDO81_008875 [Engystomops pustulosus]|uniref:Secreted protein n=1 Tax=Engystomops pustulosus TaxID=76066 RepID=A0AAV7BN01_ENGPU|nr:hypothetical protein GDO81_008875 [Engystomops pustulosus]